MDDKFLLPVGGAVERLLIHGACTDSFHDFGGGHFLPRNDDSNPGLYHVRYGLPFSDARLKDIPLTRAVNTVKFPDVLHDENQLFQELFNGFPLLGAKTIQAPPAKMETVTNDFAQYLESLAPAANGMREQKHTFQNTIHGSETYTIRLLTQDGVSDIKPMFNKGSKPGVRPVVLPSCTITTDTFYKFFGSDQINLLFDAQCIKVMKLLQYAEPTGAPLTVRRIHNREVINDPAPKTFEDPSGRWNSNMTHSVEFDADPTFINYQHYEPKDGGDPLDRDKFYSALDFKLSPLYNAPFSMKSGNKPAASIEVLQNGSLILHSDNDPHISNRISQCWLRIKNAFDKGAGKKKNHIEVAAHYQCKRSGDWLQALSCLDLGRKYKSYTDGVPTAAAAAALTKKNIILVTHDRVLLWYCIMVGIDVLFTYRSNPKSGEKEEDDDDDEDDEEVGGDEVAVVGEDGVARRIPNRAFLIYFSNDKRSKTPTEMNEELIQTAAETAAQQIFDAIKVRMVQYNTWLEELYDEIMDEIDANMATITNDVANVSAAEIKQRNIAIVEIYRSYMKLTTLDFHALDENVLDIKRGVFSRLYQERAALIAQKATTPDYATKYGSLLTKCAASASDYLRDFTNNQQICNTVPTKESLASSRSSYKSNEYFMNMPVFHKLYLTRSGSVFKEEAYVAKYAGWLVENISTFEWAAGFLLVNTRRIKQEYFDNPKIRKAGEIFFFDKFVNNIEVIYKARFGADDNFMKNIEKNAAGVRAELFSRDKRTFKEQDLVDLQAPLLIIEETRKGLTDERGNFYAARPRLDKRAEFNRRSAETQDGSLALPVGDDADAELAGVNVEIVNAEHGKIIDGVEEVEEEEAALDEELERGALKRNDKGLRPDPIVEDPPSGFRQFSKSIFSMTGPLRKYISGLFYPTIKPAIDASEYVQASRAARPRARPGALSEAAQQAMGEGRGASRGGASLVNTDAMINPNAILPTTAHILYILYINQLVISIDGFDSEGDIDYYYYDGLGRLVTSVLEHTGTDDYNKMVELLYYTIPSGDWNKEGKFAMNKDYELTLTYVGKQVAMQAIGRMSGDLPRFDFGAAIPVDSGKLYEQLRSDVKGKDFSERKMAIISRLLDLQIRPGPALSTDVASSFATSTTSSSSSNSNASSSNGSTPGPRPGLIFSIPNSAISGYNSSLKNKLLALKQSMARSRLVSTMKNLPSKGFRPIGINNNENPSIYNNITRRAVAVPVVAAPAAAAAAGGGRKTLKRRARKTRRA